MGLSRASKYLAVATGGLVGLASQAAIKAGAYVGGKVLDRIESGARKRDAARVADNRRIVESQGGLRGWDR